jgi:glycosyltransferase involved in cell wall biosynthesis
VSGHPTSRVSVIVPVCKAETTIREAIASVDAQAFRDGEIIVVDDASPDRTAEIVRTEFPRVTLIGLPDNRGPAAARNAGIAKAGGEWIAFLDGDDAWLPWRLALQFDALRENPDAVLLCGGVSLFGEPAPGAPAAEAARRATRRVALEEFIDDNPVPTSTVLARAETVRRVGGFDERFRGPEDIDLWMRMAAAGPVVKIELPLARYRERPGSLCMDQDRFLPQIVAVYDKAFGPGGALAGRRRLHRRAIAGRYVSAAWSYLVCGRRGRALALLLRSWRVWPRRLKVEQRRPAWRLIMLVNILLNRT